MTQTSVTTNWLQGILSGARRNVTYVLAEVLEVMLAGLFSGVVRTTCESDIILSLPS